MSDDNGFDDILDTLRSWLRWLWLIALLGVLGAVLAVVGDRALETAEPRADATIGLTDAVVWPYHEAVLAEHLGYFGDPAVQERAFAAAGLPVSPGDVELEARTSTIEISVQAGDVAQAEALANAVATELVAAGVTGLGAEAAAEVVELTELTAAARQTVDDLQARILQLEEEYAVASGSGQAALQLELEELRRQYSYELDQLNDVQLRLRRAEAAAAGVDPEMQVLREAEGTGTGASDTTLVVLGGAIGVLLGLAITPFVERRYGRVRDGRHAELRRRSERWIDLGGRQGPLPTPDLGDLVAAPLSHGSSPIAVLALGDEDDAKAVSALLGARLARTVVDGGAVNQLRSASAALQAGAAVLIVRSGRARRRTLARTLDRLAELDVTVEAVLLIGRSEELPVPGSGARTRVEGASEPLEAGRR
jgi:hypothetical protein